MRFAASSTRRINYSYECNCHYMDLCHGRCPDRNLRDRTALYLMKELQGAIKVGARIMFAGGIYGKIVKIKNDVIDVEINKSTVIQISRYSIQNVISE